MNKKIRIAVQSKGRLAKASLKFLASLGLKFNVEKRTLLAKCDNPKVEIIFLRDDDIPKYVEQGFADFGIVGENVICEKKFQVKVVKKLNFGLCSLVIAVPVKSLIKVVEDLTGQRIATSYPNLLKSFLEQREISAAVFKLKGSVEVAPALNFGDAICDLTQSGKTLKENGLKVIDKVMDSQAVLIAAPLGLMDFDFLI